MLSQEERTELYGFLNRLQGQTVRVEVGSRINIGMRMSFSVKLEKVGDAFNFTSNTGEVSVFIDPNEAEGFTADHSSVSLLFGDNLVTVRFARSR